MSGALPSAQQVEPRRRNQDGLTIRVVPVPRGHKFLLAGVGVVLAAALAWAIFDKVPTVANGRGAFLYAAPLQELVIPISPGGDAVVETVRVALDQTVAAGQVLLTLRLPDLDQQIISARQSLAGLTADNQELARALAERKIFNETLEGDRRKVIIETLALLSAQRTELEGILSGQKSLYSTGNATRSTVYDFRQRYDKAITDIAEQRSDLLAIDTRLSEARERQFTQLSESTRRVEEQQRTLAGLEERRDRLQIVTSPRAGFINSILTSDGHNVGARDVVLTLSTGGKSLDVIGFVEARQATRIKPGMTAYVVPSTVRKAEYGSLLGRITYISQTPVSAAEIDALLSDKEMTTHFTQSGPVFLVRIEPLPDPDNPSLFAWTSKQGPPFKVESGTLAEIQVVTKEQAPITLVMPALRELTGVQ